MINKDTDITVYKNGYVLYHAGSKCTVFVLPEKGCYSYDSVNVASVLDGEFFENEAWYFVSVKYSCGFPDPQVFPIIVVDRYLDYFSTIMDRL